MRLVEVPVAEAAGRIVAHRHPIGGRALAKGAEITPEDVAAFRDAGVATVVAVDFGPDDLREDEVAARIATAAAGAGVLAGDVSRGRAELVAAEAGLLALDRDRIVALNLLSDGFALSTLAPGARVAAGDLVGVVKVIPLAMPGPVVQEGVELLAGPGVLRVEQFRPGRAGLVVTVAGQTRDAVLQKSEAAARERIEAAGSTLAKVRRVEHTVPALASALASLVADGCAPVLVHAASSSMHVDDVVPRAIEEAGAELVRVGIPLEPGNQMLLARSGEAWILTVPGCATSRKRTAFDVVLEQVLVGRELDRAALAALAVGGLLGGRARRRLDADRAPVPRGVAGVVLAAGRSTRMGREDKLVLDLGGRPMVRRVVEIALEADLPRVIVVCGPDDSAVRKALDGLGSGRVELVANPDAERGMGTSVRAGIRMLDGRETTAAVILLGDMPLVSPDTIRALVAAYEPGAGISACVPEHDGRRGNPVLWGRDRFADLLGLTGDPGARALLREFDQEVREVPVDDRGILVDVDDVQGLEVARGAFDGL